MTEFQQKTLITLILQQIYPGVVYTNSIPCVPWQPHRSPIFPNNIITVSTSAAIDTRQTKTISNSTIRFVLSTPVDLKSKLLFLGSSLGKILFSKTRFAPKLLWTLGAETSPLLSFLPSSRHQLWKTGFTTRKGPPLVADRVFEEAIPKLDGFSPYCPCREQIETDPTEPLYFQVNLRLDTLEWFQILITPLPVMKILTYMYVLGNLMSF